MIGRKTGLVPQRKNRILNSEHGFIGVALIGLLIVTVIILILFLKSAKQGLEVKKALDKKNTPEVRCSDAIDGIAQIIRTYQSAHGGEIPPNYDILLLEMPHLKAQLDPLMSDSIWKMYPRIIRVYHGFTLRGVCINDLEMVWPPKKPRTPPEGQESGGTSQPGGGDPGAELQRRAREIERQLRESEHGN